MSSDLSRRIVALAAMPVWLAFAAAAQDSGPTAPIAALDDALLAAMKAGRQTPFAQRAASLTPVVQRSFALPAILQASVGLRYASFSPAEQASLLAAFTHYTVASYAANFDHFSGERFTIDPRTRAVGAEQVVQTQIVPAQGDPTRLDYVMRQGPAGWQAVDVLVDGSISRVAVQRSDFRGLLQGGVGNLIASLDAKAARLASGGQS
jgi:phospholipid transport system substrate-binding protein